MQNGCVGRVLKHFAVEIVAEKPLSDEVPMLMNFL